MKLDWINVKQDVVRLVFCSVTVLCNIVSTSRYPKKGLRAYALAAADCSLRSGQGQARTMFTVG